MKPHGNRARLGGVLLALVLGATALLALPAIGTGHGDHRGPRPAGTISSFDPETGVLSVALAKGGEISARVLRRTQIRCGEDRRGRRHHRRGRRRGHGHDGGATLSRRGSDEDEDRSGPDSDDDNELDEGDRRGHGEDESGDDHDEHGVEAGEDHHGDGHRGDDRGRHGCNAGDLVEGAVVMKAEIVLTHGSAFFKKIGLLPRQAVDPAPQPEEPEMTE